MKDKLVRLNELVMRRNKSIVGEVADTQFLKFIETLPNTLNEKANKEFEELYKFANGFEFNGLIIYSLDEKSKNSIYDMNNVWHENNDLEYFIFFGDSDISWYCYDLENEIFCELDKPSGTLMGVYDTFSDLISFAIETIL